VNKDQSNYNLLNTRWTETNQTVILNVSDTYKPYQGLFEGTLFYCLFPVTQNNDIKIRDIKYVK